MLFYFTGTGNSLYAAKQIEEAPLSIPQVMKQAELDFTADQIGIAAPIYGHEVPNMVREFLRRGSFHTDSPTETATAGRPNWRISCAGSAASSPSTSMCS